MDSWIGLAIIVLMGKVFCNPITTNHSVEVTYAELQTLGISCYPSDSCHKNGTDFWLYPQSCDCGSTCSLYETCCVDSEFRNPKSPSVLKSNFKCLQVYNTPGFEIVMVDSCKNNDRSDDLCYSEPEESNDPFLAIPVTSNLTGVTYKNYFCAICNEEVSTEQLHFWDMRILSNDTMLLNISEPKLKFNKAMNLWTVNGFKDNDTASNFPVTVQIQQNLRAWVKYCSQHLVGICPKNWTDEIVAKKCRDYMATVIGSHNVKYRNPHCALCNFESLSNLQCEKLESYGISTYGYPHTSSVGVDIPLLNLFVLEDRQKRCGRNMVYDQFADKCRCDSRISVKENGKCVYKI